MKGVKQVKQSTGRMRKHRYSTEFKVTAVKMASSPDIEVQAVATALGIHPFMLSRWRKEYREGKYMPDRRVKKAADFWEQHSQLAA